MVAHARHRTDLRQRAAEQFIVAAPAEFAPVEPEQGQRVAVGGDEAMPLEHQQPFARRVEQRGIGMQAHEHAVRAGLVEEAALDLVDRQLHHAERVHVVHAGMTGKVEHAGEAAERVEDRRGRTAQDAVRLEVVLAATHLDRAPLDQRGADRIGAGRAFAPRHARPQRDARGLVEKAGIADGVQHEAVRPGEDRDRSRRAGAGVQGLQFGPAQAAQRFVAILQLVQLRGRGRFDFRTTARRHAARRATLPRLEDHARDEADRPLPRGEEALAGGQHAGGIGGTRHGAP